MAGKPKPIESRFWPKVDKNGPVPPHRPELGPCWIWLGTKKWNRGTHPYGIIGIRRGHAEYVHRLSWMMHFGHIPFGLWVLHRCDTGICVRPDHLFLGTAKDNIDDMTAKGRHYLQRDPSKARGERNPAARLTDDLVRQIRASHAGGQTVASIARQLGRGENTIRHVVQRNHWTHVE